MNAKQWARSSKGCFIQTVMLVCIPVRSWCFRELPDLRLVTRHGAVGLSCLVENFPTTIGRPMPLTVEASLPIRTAISLFVMPWG